MSIHIKRLEVGTMKANCYIVWDETLHALIIDPGDDADYIMRVLQDNELTPQLIVSTHGHFDHVMSAFELKLAYTIPFYMHEADQFLLDRMQETALYFIKQNTLPAPFVEHYVTQESKIFIGKSEFDVLHTPGHTPGSIAIFHKQSTSIFVGDVVFADGNIGRTDFSYSSGQELEKSIQRIKNLGEKLIVYPGHGEEFNLTPDLPAQGR